MTTKFHRHILTDQRVARPTHPKKEVEAAIRYAEEHGWVVRIGGSHAWGKIYCPDNDTDCRCGEFCITSIWSTPRNPGNFARQIRRVVDGCTAAGMQRAERTGNDSRDKE